MDKKNNISKGIIIISNTDVKTFCPLYENPCQNHVACQIVKLTSFRD